MKKEELLPDTYHIVNKRGQVKLADCYKEENSNKRWSKAALFEQNTLDRVTASHFGSFRECKDAAELWEKDPDYAVQILPVSGTDDKWVLVMVLAGK